MTALKAATIRKRIRSGRSRELALTDPLYKRTVFVTPELRRRALELGINPKTVWKRVHQAGETLEQALSRPSRTTGITARAEAVGVHRTTIYKRRNRYGMTVEQAFSMPEDSRCQSCNEIAKLHADHDHVTGKFRGWLCQCCNLGLGAFKDSVEKMRLAIAYRERYD
jgi:hypothetical protein